MKLPSVLSLLFTSAISALTLLQVAGAADAPTPFPDAKNEAAWPGKGPIRVFDWMIQNRNYFWTQREKDQDGIVFVGDSLTGNWKTLKTDFPNMKVVNRGIGGDGSRGVLFRFKEDVIDLKPKAIILCIGSNDLSAHGSPADIESNIVEIIKQAREYKSSVPIILCTIPPRDSASAPTKEGAQLDINTRTLKLGKPGKDFEVLDLYTVLATKEGKPTPEYFVEDRLHLAGPGYQKWAEALKPVMERLDIK